MAPEEDLIKMKKYHFFEELLDRKHLQKVRTLYYRISLSSFLPGLSIKAA